MKLSRLARDRRTIIPLLLSAYVAVPAALGGCSGDDSNVAPDAGGVNATADGTANDSSAADGQAMNDAAGDSSAKGDSSTTTPDGGGDATSDTGSAEASTDGGGPEAATDSGVPEASADGGPLRPLACTTWKHASPIVLEDLSLDDAQGDYTPSLWIGEPAPGQLRVVTQPPGTSFRVYSLAKSTGTTTTFDGPAPGGQDILDSTKYFKLTTGDTAAQIVVDQASAVPESLAVYLVPDTVTSSGMLPPPILTGTGYVSSYPLTNSQLFVAQETAAVYEVTSTLYTVAVGIAPGTLNTLDTSLNDNVFLSPQIAHANGQMYLFSSNELVQGGAFSWSVSDTGNVTSPPVLPRSFDTGEVGFMVDVAPGAASETTNLAYYTLSAGQTSATFDVGQVANAQLGTVTAAGLSQVRAFDDLTVAPLSGFASAQWYGDDIAVVGTGELTDDGGTAAGVGFVWANANGTVRAAQLGPSAILQSETSPIIRAVAAPSSISATSAQWDVVWVESQAGGDVLLYNELDCELAD